MKFDYVVVYGCGTPPPYPYDGEGPFEISGDDIVKLSLTYDVAIMYIKPQPLTKKTNQ